MEQNTATIGDVQQHTDVTVTEEPRDELPTITGNKYFILLPGKTFKPQEDIIRNVLQQISGLQDVSTAEKCDVVLVFCFIVSRAGTDIDAAVNELNGLSESKPAVFMVLHHTFDPEKIIPDSSRYVNRTDTLTVDCLFYEGEFLKCVRNNEALDKIKQWLQPQAFFRTKLKVEQNTATIGDVQQHTDVTVTGEPRDELRTITGNKYFILLPGKTFKPQEDIIRNFLQQISGLQEVSTAEECDVVLVFCFIVSRAGTEIDAAVNKLNGLSESKPAVFMVLHHTFDPEKIIPDSSRYVNRTDTLTVDCLFYEGEFLKCVRNNEALDKIKQRLQPQCLEQNWVYSVIQYIMLWIRSVPGSIWVTEADTEMPKANSSEMDLQFKSSLMLVLLGMSGSEKTAVKHMIFGREESQANTSPAVLKEFTAENGEVDKWRVSVINTPDMLYSELSLEEIKQNKQLCNGQDLPYTFLLVIPAKQFFKEEREIVMKMEKRLEEGCLERLMIVVTVTDKHEKLKTENHKFQKLEEKFGNHFHVLNINETGNRRQVSELLKKAEEMVESSDDFESFEFVNKDELLI